MAYILQITMIVLIASGVVLLLTTLTVGTIYYDGDDRGFKVVLSMFAISVSLIVCGIIGNQIGKPSTVEYTPDMYDWAKIEADEDVKTRIDENGKERLVGYTFGNYETFVHYVTPTPTPVPTPDHPEWMRGSSQKS